MNRSCCMMATQGDEAYQYRRAALATFMGVGRRRRVTETAPPPYYFGVTFFDAWLLGIYLSAAPMASTDAPSTRGRRVPSRVVRASRPLLRRAGAWSFPTRVFLDFFSCRPRHCVYKDAFFFVRVLTILVFGTKKLSLSSSARVAGRETIVATRILSLHLTDAC